MYQILLSKEMYEFLLLCLKSLLKVINILGKLFPGDFVPGPLCSRVVDLISYIEHSAKDLY